MASWQKQTVAGGAGGFGAWAQQWGCTELGGSMAGGPPQSSRSWCCAQRSSGEMRVGSAVQVMRSRTRALDGSLCPKCQRSKGGVGSYSVWEEVRLSFGNCSSRFMFIRMKIESFMTELQFAKRMDGRAKHSSVDFQSCISEHILPLFI